MDGPLKKQKTENKPFDKKRFKLITLLGSGGIADVALYMDTLDNRKVAVKSTTNPHELEAMKELRECKYIVSLYDIFTENNRPVMVMECCANSLHKSWVSPISKTGNFVTASTMKRYMMELCSAVNYMHKRNWMHRDIKPENILISFDGHIRLSDFGLASSFQKDTLQMHQNPVATIWYRPPEILMHPTEVHSRLSYDEKLDVWGVLCVFAWLVTGYELFYTRAQGDGSSFENMVAQRECIWMVCGTPDGKETWPCYLQEYVDKCYSVPRSRCVKNVLQSRTKSKRPDIITPEFLNMMEVSLLTNPTLRPSMETLMKHDYFAKESPPAYTHGYPKPVAK